MTISVPLQKFHFSICLYLAEGIVKSSPSPLNEHDMD